MSLTIYIILILVLLLLRTPVAFALLGPSLMYMLMNDHSAGLATRLVIEQVNSWPLLAVPLFILLGVLANQSGITDRLFDAVIATIGQLRGSLAYVTVVTSFLFSWMSGSALADAAALGKIQVSALEKRGYDRTYAVGLSATSALISPVMPPSIPAVIFASIASVSTAALFAASIVPAMFLAGSLLVTVYFWARKKDHLVGPKFDFKTWRTATVRVILPMGVPVVILGGILGGFVTPTEAAAIGVVYVLVLALFYRTVTFRDIPGILKEASITTAAITIIIGASGLLGWILARERVPQAVAEWMIGFTDNPLTFLFLVNILLIVMGMFIEPTSAMIITVPILLPIALEFGIDPLHFGVLVILNLMIGLLTPPLGGVIFVLNKATNTPITQVFKGILPFIPVLIINLVAISMIPAISLYLPQILGLV